MPLSEATELGSADSDRFRAIKTLNEGVDVVPDPRIECGTTPTGEAVVAGPKEPGPRAFGGQELPLKDIDSLDGLNLGPQFSSGELRDARGPKCCQRGESSQGRRCIRQLP